MRFDSNRATTFLQTFEVVRRFWKRTRIVPPMTINNGNLIHDADLKGWIRSTFNVQRDTFPPSTCNHHRPLDCRIPKQGAMQQPWRRTDEIDLE